MTRSADPITDGDLGAYVDDQLPAHRRIEVEAHLSREPEAAARVMADLRLRDELRLSMEAGPRIGRVGTADAARRLERGLRRDRAVLRLRRAAAVAAFVAIGWFAHAQTGAFRIDRVGASTAPPAFVDDAVMAHRTSLMRSDMHSQPVAPVYDAAEILARTSIRVPDLPAGWTAADVELFPSRYGPSVEMALRAGEFGALSLFATRPGGFEVQPVATALRGTVNAAYWQVGEIAYALVGEADGPTLDRAARQLSRPID